MSMPKNMRKRKTLLEIKKYPKIVAYLNQADKHMEAIGFTEHGTKHAQIVSKRAQEIISTLGYSKKDAELAAVSGYLHDIGNIVSRSNHEISGALISMRILEELNFHPEEIAQICGAIGNHEEETGEPVNPLCAALIIADKSDVRRSRVKSTKTLSVDIHDRINYSVEDSTLNVISGKITLDLKINTKIAPVMEYFEIFLHRMIASRKAAKYLGCDFKLIINDYKFL